MFATTAHIDTFARDNLPPPEQWPQLRFDLPELQYPLRVNCVDLLLDRAVVEGHGDRVAIYAPAGNLTYRELQRAANRIAQVLVADLGLVPGNRVLLRAPNNPLLAAAWFGVVKAGGIVVATMPLLRAGELAQIARKARIDHVLCDVRLIGDLQIAAAQSGLLRRCLTFGDGMLEAHMAAYDGVFQNVDTACDDVCLFAFTSGTTGEPKATVHFHRDVLAMSDVVARHLLETATDDIYLGSPPLGFTFGLGALLVFPLRFRAATVLIENPTPDNLLAAVEQYRATCLFTAPTMYRTLTAQVRREAMTSLRRCVSAGEPLAKAISDNWYNATGIRLIDGIGATELIHIFISAKGDAIRPGATGKPLPGYEAIIVDEKMRVLGRGQSGRLAVRGPTGCKYLDDARQQEYVVDGWNLTGDRYRVDQDGYFWFEARIDDMIVSSGYNISGPEVEIALLTHEAVQEVAVIGAPDEERGQIVKAFVVLRVGRTPDLALVRALQSHVKATIAPYKYPRCVEFVATLPKTATGKVQRSVLRKSETDPGRVKGAIFC